MRGGLVRNQYTLKNKYANLAEIPTSAPTVHSI